MGMYTVIYPAVRVHRTGCHDIGRDLRNPRIESDGGVREFGTLQRISDDLNRSFGWAPDSGEPEPWPVSALDLAPCAVEFYRARRAEGEEA